MEDNTKISNVDIIPTFEELQAYYEKHDIQPDEFFTIKVKEDTTYDEVFELYFDTTLSDKKPRLTYGVIYGNIDEAENWQPRDRVYDFTPEGYKELKADLYGELLDRSILLASAILSIKRSM